MKALRRVACSIGGNVAENSGGVHCLKYGLTANNVLGVELVTIEGEIIRLGGKHLESEDSRMLVPGLPHQGSSSVVHEGDREEAACGAQAATTAGR